LKGGAVKKRVPREKLGVSRGTEGKLSFRSE